MATIQTVSPYDTLAVLKAAKDWLSDPDHWTTQEAWRATNGRATAYRREVAKTCVYGAGALVSRGYGTPDGFIVALEDALGASAPKVNDGPDGYPKVMAGLRKAIETLEAER